MANAPARPASVPAEAVFSEDVESWEIGGRSADGRRRGLCTFYRPDGMLYLRGEFEGGDIGAYAAGFRAAGLTDVTTGVIEGAGHFAPDQAPAAVWRLIKEYDDRLV